MALISRGVGFILLRIGAVAVTGGKRLDLFKPLGLLVVFRPDGSVIGKDRLCIGAFELFAFGGNEMLLEEIRYVGENVLSGGEVLTGLLAASAYRNYCFYLCPVLLHEGIKRFIVLGCPAIEKRHHLGARKA